MRHCIVTVLHFNFSAREQKRQLAVPIDATASVALSMMKWQVRPAMCWRAVAQAHPQQQDILRPHL
jgi:hypothetical protein